MLIVFQRGRYWLPNSNVSTTRRIDGSGGKINSFWAMYSFRMSFWMVPPSTSIGMPRFSAMAMYMAHTIAAGLLIVIDVVIWSTGMPSNSTSMSASDDTATPHLPNSPRASGASES